MLIQIIYGLFFILALFSALMVVLSPHAIHSALYLVLTMVSISGLFMMMNAQLAAAFQIIVYAGAIMVLFLFVVMLLNVGNQGAPPRRTRPVRQLGMLLVLAFIAQMAAVCGFFIRQAPPVTLQEAPGISIQAVARLLLTNYIFAFEAVSLLLLVAVVGAVVLARRLSPAQPAPAAPAVEVREKVGSGV